MDAAIVIYPGVRAFEAAGALAALRAAQLDARWLAADALVGTSEGARLVPHGLGFDALADAPAVILPGGDITVALRDAALTRALRARRGRTLLASAEGIRIASAAGLLDGARVSVAPGERAPGGAIAVPARLARDGRVLTCFAPDALIDLTLHHVAHEHGDARARSAADALGRAYSPFVMGSRGE